MGRQRLRLDSSRNSETKPLGLGSNARKETPGRPKFRALQRKGRIMKHHWHTAWHGQDIVVYRDENEVDRLHAPDIRRVIFVQDGPGLSAGDLAFAVVEFDGRAVEYDFGDLDELQLAYCCSIHKSQGSEYAAVVIPLHTTHYIMLQRNVLYTGITRGKRLVVLVGQKKALSIAVHGQQTRRRWSKLKEWLDR